MKKYFFMKFKINNINKLMFKINECCMNIENTNLHNILSTLISNQASLYSKVSGNLNDIFYVETFDSEPSVSGLYINHDGESRYWTGIEWEYISNEVSDIIDVNSTSGTVPTSKAVYDFVNSRTSGSVTDGVITEINGKIEDVSGDVKTISESLPNYTLKSELTNSLTNYALKSELSENYALKSELPYEIHYVDSFPESPVTSGLYISSDGQSKLWVNGSWIQTSKELIDEILDSDKNNTDIIPSVKAVYDFVDSRTSGSVSDSVITEINGKLESVSGDVKTITGNLANYALKSELTNSLANYTLKSELTENLANYALKSELPYDIFYVETFDSEPSVSGLYINHNGESRYWTGSKWEYVSNEISDIIDTNSTSGTVPTSKAVYDFVTASLNEFTPSTDTNVREVYYLSGIEFEEQPAVSGIYINSKGESKFWNGTEYEDLSLAVSNEINESSTSGTVPTSKSIYDFVTSSLAQNELSNKEIYYITSFDNLEVSGAGLYIDQDGQSKYWTGTEWELTSVETSNIISSSSTSGTIPTSKAVYDFVDSRTSGSVSNDVITEINGKIETVSGDVKTITNSLANYTLKSELTNSLANYTLKSELTNNLTNYTLKSELTNSLANYALKSELPYDVFYVETFDSEPSVSGLYINHNGESRYWTGSKWEYVSNEISDTIDTNSTSGTVPTSKAVYDFVTSSLQNNEGSAVNEVFYIESFDNYTPTISGIYIDQNGQSKFYSGSEWEQISNEVVDSFNDSNIESVKYYLPSVSAVYDFVNSKIENVGKDIYYLTGTIFEDAPANIGLYINTDGYSKYWNGSEYEDLSIMSIDRINESNIDQLSGSVPTSKAVCDYVNSKLENVGKDIYYLTGTVFEDAPDNIGLYINTDGQSKYWNGTEYEDLSIMCIDDIDESNIDQISGTIPTSKAVYDYISERNFGLSKTWKTVSTTSGSYAVVIGNGLQQKVTLTGNITLTPPVLNSTYYSLILQITKTSNQTVSINSTTVLDSSKVGTFQIKWFYDGTNTYRYEPIQVYID